MSKRLSRVSLMGALTLTLLIFSPGCALTRSKATARNYLDDKTIATRIQTTLVTDPKVKAADLKVQAINGVVELSGYVPSESARSRAGELAASTPGVNRVYNNLLLPTGRGGGYLKR